MPAPGLQPACRPNRDIVHEYGYSQNSTRPISRLLYAMFTEQSAPIYAVSLRHAEIAVSRCLMEATRAQALWCRHARFRADATAML